SPWCRRRRRVAGRCRRADLRKELLMIGSSWKAVLGALGCAALAFGLSLPAGAQEQTKPLAQQQAPGQVTDAEIASFAKAARKVKQINDEALPQIQAAETPEKAQQLREKAESDMLAAVR